MHVSEVSCNLISVVLWLPKVTILLFFYCCYVAFYCDNQLNEDISFRLGKDLYHYAIHYTSKLADEAASASAPKCLQVELHFSTQASKDLKDGTMSENHVLRHTFDLLRRCLRA